MKRKRKTARCPFCNSSSELYKSCVGRFMVYCRRCKCATKFFDTEKEAADTWNKRSANSSVNSIPEEDNNDD